MPFYYHSMVGISVIVKVISVSGAHVNMINSEGKSGLMLAEEQGYKRAVRILRAAGGCSAPRKRKR